MDPVAEEEDAAKFEKPRSNVKETKSTKQYSDTRKEDLLSRRNIKNPQSSEGSSLSSTSSASLNGRHTSRSFVANTSSSTSDVIDPTPGAYNVDEIPPSQDEMGFDLLSNCKNPPSSESSSLSNASLNGRHTSRSFVANTSSSASDVIEQSPDAYNFAEMTIPSTQDEEVDLVENVCTPSEKIASLHLSGQRSSPDKADASPNHDYDPKVINISSPSQALESDTEAVDISNKFETVETEAYFSKETIDAFEIPKFQQVLNEGQLLKENIQSSTNSSKSESPEAIEADHEVTQSGQFQAWQTSVGSSFTDGTRSRSTSAGKPVLAASDNQTHKDEPAKLRELSSEPSIPKMVNIEKLTEKTRSASDPPRKTKKSKQPLENPANTQYLLSDDAPNQTTTAQKKETSSLRLHFTETAQDSGLGEPSTSKATESRQSKEADVVLFHGESNCEEDLFGDESNNEGDLATKKDAIDKLEGNDKCKSDVVEASQDWHLHFTQTQGDTQGGRNSDGDRGDNNKQVIASETSQSVFQKPKDVSSSRTPNIVDLSPVEEYQNSSFIKNSNISESPQERSGTGFHFSLPKDDSLKPVSEVISSVADIMKKCLHHSTPISEKEDSTESDEMTSNPENQVESVNENPVPSIHAETVPYSEGTPVFNIILPPNASGLAKITSESSKSISSIVTGVEKAKESNPDVSDRCNNSFNDERNEGNQQSAGTTSAVQDGERYEKTLNFSGDTEIIEDDEEDNTAGNVGRQSVNQTCGREKDIVAKVKDSVKRSATSARRQSPRKHCNGQKERRDPFEFSDSQCYGTPVQSKRQTDMGGTISIKRRRLVGPQSGQSGRKNVKKFSKNLSPGSTGKTTAKRKTPIRSGQVNRGDSSKVDEHATANEEKNQPSTSTKVIENPLDKSDSNVTWFKKITTVMTTNVSRYIREEAIRNGVIIEVKETTEVDPPIVKVTEHQDPTPVSPSRTTSSITSGDLGDVSSLSTSKSSSSSGNSFMRSLSSTSLPRSSNVIISPQLSTTDSSEKGTRLGANKQTPNKPNCNEDDHLKNKVKTSTDKSLKKVAFTEPSTSTHLTRARRCFSDDSLHLSLKSKEQRVPKRTNEDKEPQVEEITGSLTSLKPNQQVITSERHEAYKSVDERTTDFSNSSKTTENSKSLTVKNKTVSNIKEVELSSKNQPSRRCSPRKAKGIQNTEKSSEMEPPQPEEIKDCSNLRISLTSLKTNPQGITSERHEGNKSFGERTTDSSSSSKTTENTESLKSKNQTMSNIKEKEVNSKKQPPRRHSPRKAKGIQTSEESSGDLTEPPEPELGNYLLPGVRVLARWRDGYYYPGTIDKEDSPNRYLFCFDDGDLRVVAINDILHKSWLPKGQMVLAAESSNELYSLGKIIGYFRDDEDSCGYIIENNSGESQRYHRSKVILNKEQATPLIQSPANTYLNTGLNLDNIVPGKRLRGRSAADTSGSSNVDKPQTSKKATDKKLKGSPAVTSPRKRIRTPLKDQEESLVEKPYTPTLKRRKTRTEDEDSTSSTPVHASTFMGQLPKNKSLFKGINFLITVGDVVKKPSTSPTDTSTGSNSEDEMLMKFNRDYACKQIMVGGGNVLKSYDSSHKCLGKVYLISNTHCRTKKYFQALAAGLPCISHQWLKHSCNLNALQDIQSYVLYAGESLVEGELIECTMKRSVLRGMNIMVVSEQEETKNTWTSILHAARCDVVSNLPSVPLGADVAFTCDVIVTDQTCPKSIRDKAAELDVPMVSTEWVIQCLINGYRPDYCAHPSYVWNYCKKKH